MAEQEAIVRATLAANILQTMSVSKGRLFLARTGLFLFAGILFLWPSCSSAAVAIKVSPTGVNFSATVAVPGFIHTGLLYSGACTATLLPGGKILYTGGQVAGLSASPESGSDNAEIYDPVALTSTPTGNMTVPRCGETVTLLPTGEVLFAGGQTLGGGTASAELYDPIAGVFSATGSMSVARVGHAATLLASGEVLIAGGGNCNSGCVAYNTAELYDPGSGTFHPATSNLSAAYTGAAAILLPNGTVLIAGGSSGGANLNSFAEIYDPATGTFTQSGAMINVRQAFTATLLQNGKVLFVGGKLSSAVITSAAEIYDPATRTFAATGNLNFPRDFHSATLLLDGKVLIAGGMSTISRPASAEIYDPTAGTFSLTGSLQEPRNNHSATALPDGSVLVADGTDGQLLSSIETYDPASGVFTSPGVFMKATRMGHGTTQLADGRMLLTGGQDASFNVNSSAEIFDPAAGIFSLTGSLNQGRYGHTATLLNNGNVLVVGGYSDPGGTNLVPLAELYDTVSGTFSLTASPNVPRAYHTATLLPNGMVLIAGGEIAGGQAASSAELYDPQAGSFTPAGNMSAPRYNHTATLLNDGRVLIAEGISGGTVSGEPDDLYDPGTGTFTPVASTSEFLQNAEIPFDSVLLSTGQVLVDQGTFFDPISNTLSVFNPLSTLSAPLQDYKFLLLLNDQVFVAGGASAAYLFDPILKAYSFAGFMEYSRSSPTARLLPNGQVLIAGGAYAMQAEFYVPPAASSNSSASPVLSLINPSSAVAGGPGFTLTVSGFNFVNSSIVNFNGAARQTTNVSATQLSISISASDIAAAGAATITVTNPANGATGGGTSNPATLTILAGNIQPVVGALSPASATAGGPTFLLNLSGNNFTTSSVVSFDGHAVPTVFSSTAELQADVPASAIAVAGTPIVTVSNPGSVPSVVVTFTVNNPVPQVSNLTPPSGMPGGTALTLDLTGTNFNSSSIVLLNGSPLATTFANSTLLHASLPASDLLQGGELKLNVTVKNPIPGGGISSALPFIVDNYTIAGPPSSVTVTAGQSAVFNLTVAPSNGTFTNPITLAAAAPPQDATASFAPSASITPDAGSPTVTLTITTTSRTAANPTYFPRGDRRVLPFICVACMAIIMVGLMPRKSDRRIQRLPPQFLWVLLLVGIAGLVACSGSAGGTSPPAQINPAPGTGTPAGTYTITITATSGAITHSTQVTLIVM
jgi:Galactose oxidase, central domain